MPGCPGAGGTDTVELRDPGLETAFPGLKGSAFAVTSPETPEYNCVAWAAGWWPDSFYVAYWPPHAPRKESIDAFIEAFQSLGFETCSTTEPETGFEKVAFFAEGNLPKHAARQLEDGDWTSKLGQDIDIRHSLSDLEGKRYETIVKVMKRPFLRTLWPRARVDRRK